MARILALTDRAPDDPEWKGAFAWKTIHSLAESQHEVRVVTPLSLESIAWAHPRLTVTQPVTSWMAIEIANLTRAVMTFQPEIIHTFVLKPNTLWPVLTVWPWLSGIGRVLPRAQRWSLFLDDDDERSKDAAMIWHRESRRVDNLPVDLEFPREPRTVLPYGEFTLVPAPVDEWESPREGLRRLAADLSRSPGMKAVIVGGWGKLPVSERRVGWGLLSRQLNQVHMTEPLSLDEFLNHAEQARTLWTEPLKRGSWRLKVSEAFTGHTTGTSAANFLSRLYMQSDKV